jgi:hypothetical protein
MTLLELAYQYKSDVETRIASLKEEKSYWLDKCYADDESIEVIGIDESIQHWTVTLNQINEVIKETENN